jgi:hypothetical protein
MMMKYALEYAPLIVLGAAIVGVAALTGNLQLF